MPNPLKELLLNLKAMHLIVHVLHPLAQKKLRFLLSVLLQQ